MTRQLPLFDVDAQLRALAERVDEVTHDHLAIAAEVARRWQDPGDRLHLETCQENP